MLLPLTLMKPRLFNNAIRHLVSRQLYLFMHADAPFYLKCGHSVDEVNMAVLRKKSRCGKLNGILRAERNRFHGYLHPIQMASLPIRDYFALRALVPSLSAQLSRPGGDDAQAAKGFFSKKLAATHIVPSRVITVDKNAAYPKVFNQLQEEGILPKTCVFR